MRKLKAAGRLMASRQHPSLMFATTMIFLHFQLTNLWTDTQSGSGYRTRSMSSRRTRRVIERCILMATDPGDLVLDPTCGSGTTATVAEQWGRRWITIDTSRVALALARARIMGARYPFYLLADSREGQLKEAEVTRTAPSSQPVHGNIRHGFVYERVPHITLKSIANNAEIDVIWDKWQRDAGAVARKVERRAQEAVAGVGDSACRRRSLGCKDPGDFLCTQSRAGTRRVRQFSEACGMAPSD